jgi:sirohydrochlorin ferrochelatase
MPIAATPLPHEVVAFATNWTVVATSLLFAGAVTVTVARAGIALASTSRNANFFMRASLFGLEVD